MMFEKQHILEVAKALGTVALIFGFLAGFMTLNALHWAGAI